MTSNDDLKPDSKDGVDGRSTDQAGLSENAEVEVEPAGRLKRYLPGRDRRFPVAILIAWLVLLAYLALLPRTPRVPVISASLASPLAHLVTSAVLAALLYWIFSVRSTSRRKNIRAAITAAELGAGTGILLEVAQGWYSNVRLFESSDILSNVVGTVFSLVFLVTLTDLGVSRRILESATVVVVALITSGLIVSLVLWDGDLPYRGDHWHVQYRVDVCGERMLPFGGFQGGIHTHGRGVIHLHPNTADEEGTNASLGLFFQRAGGEMKVDSLVMPSGERYANGDLCTDGSVGELAVWDYDPNSGRRVLRIDDPGTYVPKNNQSILIEFGEVAEAR